MTVPPRANGRHICMVYSAAGQRLDPTDMSPLMREDGVTDVAPKRKKKNWYSNLLHAVGSTRTWRERSWRGRNGDRSLSSFCAGGNQQIIKRMNDPVSPLRAASGTTGGDGANQAKPHTSRMYVCDCARARQAVKTRASRCAA